MVIAARLPAVDRRRTSRGSPFSRGWGSRLRTRESSRGSPVAFGFASRTRCNWSNTPACCQRSRRRQRVCPDPKPSSKGNSCQAMSWCRTYRMPCRHRRSATGRGPGARSGQGGSNGSISAHKPLSTIRGRVVTPTRTVRSSQQSRPARALQQDRVTSSMEHRLTFPVRARTPEATPVPRTRWQAPPENPCPHTEENPVDHCAVTAPRPAPPHRLRRTRLQSSPFGIRPHSFGERSRSVPSSRESSTSWAVAFAR